MQICCLVLDNMYFTQCFHWLLMSPSGFGSVVMGLNEIGPIFSIAITLRVPHNSAFVTENFICTLAYRFTYSNHASGPQGRDEGLRGFY